MDLAASQLEVSSLPATFHNVERCCASYLGREVNIGHSQLNLANHINDWPSQTCPLMQWEHKFYGSNQPHFQWDLRLAQEMEPIYRVLSIEACGYKGHGP